MAHFPCEIENDKAGEIITVLHMVASTQAYVGYLFMSVYAVNPSIAPGFSIEKHGMYLSSSVVVGMSIMIFSRPCLQSINFHHRTYFGAFGSAMFNLGSFAVFKLLRKKVPDNPKVLTALGLVAATFMLTEFVLFFYYMDTRIITYLHRIKLFELLLGTHEDDSMLDL